MKTQKTKMLSCNLTNTDIKKINCFNHYGEDIAENTGIYIYYCLCLLSSR